MKSKLFLYLFFSSLVSFSQFSLVNDINTSGNSSPSNFKEFKGKLYFTGNNGSNDKLFSTDGTSVNTHTMNLSSLDFPIVADNNFIYYFNLSGFPQLYKFDPINDVASQINATQNDTRPFVYNNTLFYSSDSDNIYVKYDSSTNTSTLLDPQDANYATYSTLSNDKISDHAIIGNSIIIPIRVETGQFGNINDIELGIMDINTPNSLTRLRDIHVGALSSSPQYLTAYNGKVYFSASNSNSPSREVWVTDGTASGTVFFKDINPSGSSDPKDFIEFNGKLYFTADDGTNGRELWVTDGTSANTVMVANIGGSTSSTPSNFSIFNNELYFSATNLAVGNELFKMDTSENVTMVMNINTGANDSSPNYFVEYNNKLYFSADDGTNGREVWVTDGTMGGTQMVGQVNASGSADPKHLTVFNGRLYFSANDGTNGEELWKYTDPSLTITWIGGVSSDWNNAANWAPAIVPGENNNVLINSGAPIISTNTSVVVNNISIDNNGGASLSVSMGASLIINGVSSGEIQYNSQILSTSSKWHLISSPTQGEQYNDTWIQDNAIATSSSNANRKAIGTYLQTDANGEWDYFETGDSGTFNEAQGYSIQRNPQGQITFIGTVLTSDGKRTLSVGNAGTANENKWNLVGNPFPAYVNVTNLLNDNASKLDNARQAIYVWNGNTSQYEALTTGYIHPSQAFFVNANNASSGDFIFGEYNLSHQTGVTFYRTSTPKIIVSLNNGSSTKATEINYLADKTTGLDPRFDIGTFTGESSDFNIFTRLVADENSEDFMRQALPNTGIENFIIPIGVNSISGQELIFKAETSNLSTDIKIYVEDKVNNTFTQIDANKEYKTTLNQSINGVGRFYLHASTQVLNVDDNTVKDVVIYKISPNTLKINGLKGNHNVKLYSIHGQEILNTSISLQGSDELKLFKVSTGIYIVKIESGEFAVTKKIVLE